MKDRYTARLNRPVLPMPDFVAAALDDHGLAASYLGRPAYQQNDFVAWILRAKRPATVKKRLDQMLDELRRGGVYMKMEHPPSRRA